MFELLWTWCGLDLCIYRAVWAIERVQRAFLLIAADFFVPPDRGAEYCDQPVCLFVCVCVCVCPWAYLWNRWTEPHEILCALADLLWPWLGPPPAALRYVMYFWFYGWLHVWPYGRDAGKGWQHSASAINYMRDRGGVWCLWMLVFYCFNARAIVIAIIL